MKKHFYLIPSMCFLFLLIASLSCNAAVITRSDGMRLKVDALGYENDKFSVRIGTETSELDRNQVKDISFSARDQKNEQLSTDSADLLPLLEEAKELYKKYPDSESVIVLDEANIQYRRDGSNLSRTRMVTLITKEEAMGIGQVSLSFDPNRHKIRILSARSLSPSGHVYSIDPQQIKISKGTSGSVYFNQYQQVSFSIPHVEVGSLVDYSYEIDEFNPFDPKLFQGQFYFQSDVPVKKSIIRVSVPHEQELHYIFRNSKDEKSEPQIIEAVDNKIYQWEYTDIEPIIGEPYMPAFRDVVPVLFYSIQKDWAYMHNRLKPMMEKRFQLTDFVKKKVDEIIEGAKDLNEKIARLYLFCQKEIRYISIKGNLASNQVGHPAEETLRNKYGDCTDKGMLLSTMLKHIGVEAYPIGIRTNPNGKVVRELPIFDDNHCITEVHLDGRIFYLDSTATDYRYPYFRSDDHDTNADNIMLRTHNPIPLPPPEDNASIRQWNLELEADGTTHVSIENTMNGSFEASSRYAARSMKPEEYDKAVRSTISRLTADYVLKVATHSDPLDFSGPYVTKTSYALNRFAPKSGKYMIFSIPFYELGFPEVSLNKRNYDIVYTTSNLRNETYTIKIPDNFSVKYLPPALRIQTPNVEFEVIYDQQGDSIKITRKLAFPRRVIPVSDYLGYKADLEKIANSSKERIFLEEVAQTGDTK